MEDQKTPKPVPIAFPRRTLLRGSVVIATGAAAVSGPLSGLAAGMTPEQFRAWLAQAQATPGATPVASPEATPGATPGATPIPVANYTPVALTDAELTALKAAVDRIIPADDLGPGAVETGVHVYIDQALIGRKAASLSNYKSGLAALDTAAGGGFASVDPDKQDAILTDAEAGKLAGGPEGFFAMLLQDTREGMFCDPIHGGNANFAGWDLIGYPGIKLVWTEEDQALNATPTPAHVSVAKYGGTAS